ncbi:MAG TPA: cytochrome c [Thermoanaerobaculia bacterium]
MKLSNAVATAMTTAILALPLAGIAADGAAIFKAKCAACHAADGSGSSPMGKKMGLRDLGSADVQKQTDAQLTDITTQGKGKMPAYESKLSADEIKAVVAHIRSLKK